MEELGFTVFFFTLQKTWTVKRIKRQTTNWRKIFAKEWPKSRKLTTASAGKSVEQRELLFIACGNVKCCSHSEASLAASYRTNYTLRLWSSHPDTQYFPKPYWKWLSWSLAKQPHTECPALGQKVNVAHLDNGIQTINDKGVDAMKKPTGKDCALYDSNCVVSCKRQDCEDK